MTPVGPAPGAGLVVVALAAEFRLALFQILAIGAQLPAGKHDRLFAIGRGNRMYLAQASAITRSPGGGAGNSPSSVTRCQ